MSKPKKNNLTTQNTSSYNLNKTETLVQNLSTSKEESIPTFLLLNPNAEITDVLRKSYPKSKIFVNIPLENCIHIHSGKEISQEINEDTPIIIWDTKQYNNITDILKWLNQQKKYFQQGKIICGVLQNNNPDKGARKWLNSVKKAIYSILSAYLCPQHPAIIAIPTKDAKYIMHHSQLNLHSILYTTRQVGLTHHIEPIKVTLDRINTPILSTLKYFFVNKLHWYILSPLQDILDQKTPLHEPYRSNNRAWMRFLFALLCFILLPLMLYLSKDFGQSGDEWMHYAQAEKVLKYYKEGDKACLNDPKLLLHYYGQSFDVITVWLIKQLNPKDPYALRHFLNALMGFIAIVFTALSAKAIGGWRAGLLAFLFISVTPRFFGHSMNNPKDIPFAAATIFGIFYTIRFIQQLPRPTIHTCFFATLGIAWAISIRVGGVLNIAYFLAFVALAVYFLDKTQRKWTSLFSTVAVIVLLGYLGGLILWPYGLQNPIKNPLTALKAMSEYPANIKIVFEGEHIWSTKIPWHYGIKYIFISNPLVVLVGFLVMIILSVQMYKREIFPQVPVLLVLFASVFPILYTIYKNSTLYNEWRHLLFVYPTLVVCSALGWSTILHFISQKTIQIVVYILVALGCLEPTVWMIQNHPNQYVYFNQLVGGTAGAYGNYETDYYMNSVKHIVEWFLKHEFEPNQHKYSKDKPLNLVTTSVGPVNYYLRNYKDKIKVTYTRYYERQWKDWDYGIFPVSIQVHNSQAKRGLYPPKGTIYTIKASGKVMCALVKNNDKNSYLGREQFRRNQIDSAFQSFKRALAYDPNDENAYNGIGRYYYSKKEFDSAMWYFRKSTVIYPEYADSYNLMGNIYMQQKNYDSAIVNIKRAVDLIPNSGNLLTGLATAYIQKGEYSSAFEPLNEALKYPPVSAETYFYLGIYYMYQRNYQSAADAFTNAINTNPKYVPAYIELINLLEKTGNKAAAQQYKQNLEKIQVTQQ
ncbi:MAG: tetratricopeptide repeat protein [Bacteroidia bacterium]|nr:tetratricopeptide repeat protein [Bacteroidia bacterium]MDW8345810.1 tetratricopeptide repeat protein [Bacteroidia bacterium]